jgi:hypothetical protein
MLEETTMSPSLTFIRDCQVGDLLRVKLNDTVEYAILGLAAHRNLQPLIALTIDSPPFSINLLEQGRIDGDFDTYAALRYGKWDITPHHQMPCQIGSGSLFNRPGVYVLVGTEPMLTVNVGPTVQYFGLTDFKLYGARGGQKAAFEMWSMWHDALEPHQHSIVYNAANL